MYSSNILGPVSRTLIYKTPFRVIIRAVFFTLISTVRLFVILTVFFVCDMDCTVVLDFFDSGILVFHIHFVRLLQTLV